MDTTSSSLVTEKFGVQPSAGQSPLPLSLLHQLFGLHRKRHRVFAAAPRSFELRMCVILHDYLLRLKIQQSLGHFASLNILSVSEMPMRFQDGEAIMANTTLKSDLLLATRSACCWLRYLFADS